MLVEESDALDPCKATFSELPGRRRCFSMSIEGRGDVDPRE